MLIRDGGSVGRDDGGGLLGCMPASGTGSGGGQESTLKRIQNYVFDFKDLLGQGNFSKVYRARRDNSTDAVAIKIVELNSLKTKKLQELLYSQIDILKRLNHPNVLRCHEVFTSNRNCYIITELCNGGDLQSILRTHKVMSESDAEPYIRAIYRGLLYLSEQGIVHRDLKVANIFVHDGEAKIADFGFAKGTRSKFKDINIGSPIYMSPEGLINNIYGPKTDIWAYGMLIYELLHGATPFSHCKSENELKYNMSIPIGWSQLKPELSTDIKELILKCLEVDEPKRIAANQLQHLSYFRSKSSNRIREGSEPMQLYSKSPLNQHSSSLTIDIDQLKYRTKTENQITPKKSVRELSGYTGERNKKDSMPHTYRTLLDSGQHFKLPLEEERKNKHTSSSSNFIPHTRFTEREKKYRNTRNNGLEEREDKVYGTIEDKLYTTFEDKPYNTNYNKPYSTKAYDTSENIVYGASENKLYIAGENKRVNEHKRYSTGEDRSFDFRITGPSTPTKEDPILSNQLTFRECVNILHYCRLLYKHLTLMRDLGFGDETQSRIFKRWLSAVLKTIMREISNKRIIYQGSNIPARERKLEEVTSEYIKKYSKELGLEVDKVRLQESALINYEKICNYFGSVQQLVDQMVNKEPSNIGLLQLAHSMVLIVDSSRTLRKCHEDKNYHRIEKFKEIEDFLSSKKQLDYNVYQNHKKKYLS